jgi:hypothetical protein
MSTQFDHADTLRARMHDAGLQFLRTELQTAFALLDISDHTATEDAAVRRRALARDAYNVVAGHLAREGVKALDLSAEERDEIGRLLEVLGRRLDEVGA